MLYMLIKVFNYKQILMYNAELVKEINNNFSKLSNTTRISQLSERDGIFFYSLGREHQVDPQKCLDTVQEFQRLLLGLKDDLFGFNLLVGLYDENKDQVLKRMRRGHLLIDEVEEIWLEEKARSFFSANIKSKKVGDFWAVKRQTKGIEFARGDGRNVWHAEPLVKRMARTARTYLEDTKGSACFLIYGSTAAERTLLVDAFCSRLLKKASARLIPRLSTVSNRRSPIHPFLNSIRGEFLNDVDEYLLSYEKAVWKESAAILRFLKQREKSSEVQIYPDHLREDFYIAYQLYLAAYFRMMESNLLAPIIICENIESYHSGALGTLQRLLADFSRSTTFIIAVTSGHQKPPAGIECDKMYSFQIRPLSLKRIGRFAASVFSGLVIPEADCRQIRRFTAGRVISLFHFLKLMEAKGQIVKDGGSFRWQLDEEAEVPDNPASMCWSFLTTLPDHLLRLLWIIYLQAGLLDRVTLVSFLSSVGLAEDLITASMAELSQYGLIHYGENIMPLFPETRQQLKNWAVTAEVGWDEKLTGFLIEQWREGRFTHLVLLYFYLVRMKRLTPTLEVLDQLLNRKIGELDFEGIQLLLNEKHLQIFTGAAAPEGQPADSSGTALFPFVLRTASLRSALLEAQMQKAEAIYPQAVALCGGFRSSPMKAGLSLQIARYHEMRGETNLALDWAKKTLIQCQQLEFPSGELKAMVELGAIMLADGKLEEALEYLSFSEQSGADHPLDELRASALLAVTLFMIGNLSRAQLEAQKAQNLAGAIRSREWELYVRFLRARLLFELGSYADAVQMLQKTVTFWRLYTIAPAENILKAWLGRAYAYWGQLDTAAGVLDELEDTAEKLFFRGEVHFLAGENHKAVESCRRAAACIRVTSYFPAERVLWQDGFAAVEGRCFSLLADSSLLYRLINSFQSYVQGLVGGIEQAIQQLYGITRGEKLPGTDPYLSVYNYFYAGSLPEESTGELDDALTVLNKALKILQLRASNIEDSSIRWQFLNKNLWNARLIEAAKNKNLL